MILSILSAAVKCEWNLSSVQEATITTVTELIVWFVNLLMHVRLCFLVSCWVIRYGALLQTSLDAKRFVMWYRYKFVLCRPKYCKCVTKIMVCFNSNFIM